jgi:minor capsid protein V18/V19
MPKIKICYLNITMSFYLPKSRAEMFGDDNADIIYYNITMTCQLAKSNTLAQYEETRTQPILDDPSQYYMSIIRFSIDGSNIPIVVCPVIPNPNNVNDINYTPFSITLQYAGVDYTSPLIFIPEINVPILPQPPTLQGQDITTQYYYMYTYTTLVVMINNAIQSAFTALITANPGVSAAGVPYFIYDRSQQKFALVVPNTVIAGTNVYQTQFNGSNIPLTGTTQAAGTINIFLNSRIYSYFDSIESYQYQDVVLSNLMLIRDLKNNYYYPSQNGANTSPPQVATSFTNTNISYTTAPVYYIFYQQYNTISNWNSLSGIVFLTSSLPIQYEYIPASAINPMSGSGFSAFRPIITDFTPVLEQAGDARTRIVYFPQGPYRLISLKSTDALYKIDLSIWWQDQYQNLYPLTISCNEADTIKIMFMKKSLAKNSNMISY